MAKKQQTVTKTNDLVTVFVPKQTRSDNQLFVGVNGKRYLIQKGVKVDVPRPVAEVLANSEAMDKIANDYIEANTSDRK